MGRPRLNNPNTESKSQKAWEQIQAQRKAAKAAKVRRVVLIVLAALVVVSLAGIGIWKISGSSNISSANPTPGKNLLTAATLTAKSVKDPDEMQGFVIGPNGVGSYKEGVPNIELYISYSCPACLNIEHVTGESLQKMATSGKANLIVHPVDTHPLIWAYIAGDAAYKVAKEDPQHLLAFHNALLKFAYEVEFKDEAAMKAQGNDTVLSNPDESLAKVKEIAKKVGVKEDLISSFSAPNDPSSSIVAKWGQNWLKEAQKQTDSIGTPMFVKDGKIFNLDKWQASEPLGDYLTK